MKFLLAVLFFLSPATYAANGYSDFGSGIPYVVPGTDGNVLTASLGNWISAPAGSGGAVSSVFGRIGAVTALIGDYSSFYLTKANNLSDLASASTARTNLGLGSSAIQNSSFFLQSANNLSDVASPSTSRTNLGLGTAATANAANLTEATSSVLTITGGSSSVLGSGTSVQVKQATTSQGGYLSSADWNTFNGKQNVVGISAGQRVYVSPQGNDTTGDGTIAKPYLTIDKANSVITDATYLKPYVIEIAAGQYSCGNIVLKPWVFFLGADTSNAGSTQLNCTSFSVDAAWKTALGSANYASFVGLYFGSSTVFNLDFNSLLPGSQPYAVITINNCLFNGDVTMSARNVGDVMQATNTAFGGNVTQHGGSFYPLLSYVSGAVSLDVVGVSDGFSFFADGSSFFGNFSIDVGSQGSNLLWMASTLPYFTTMTLTGSAAFLYHDSTLPRRSQITLNSGASLFPLSDSYALYYAPSVSSNWATVPALLQEGLDSLATGRLAFIGAGKAATATNVVLSTLDGHTKSAQTTAPVATVQASAGTGATCTIANATDTAGVVTITTGTIGLSTGSYCQIAFDKPYNVAPICVLTPAGSTLSTSVYVTSSTTNMNINFAVAGGISNTYVENFHCIETQ